MTEHTRAASTPWIMKLIHGLSKGLAFIAVVVIVFMMVATVADVTKRFIAGTPIPGVTEMGEVLMVMSVFAGVAYAEYRGAHVRVTLLLDKLPPRVAAIINSLGMLLVLTLIAWMVWVTAGRALESLEVNEVRFGLVKIPVWPGRIAIAAGLVAYFLEAIPRLIDNIVQAFSANPRLSIPETTVEL